jgi:IS30 family transposase
MLINSPKDAIALILRESLMKCGLASFLNLRFRNQRKRKYGSPETRGQLSNRKSIHDRPTEVEQRTRFGDLEIDTIVGKHHKQ